MDLENNLSLSSLSLAFDLAPVGLCISRQRAIQVANDAFALIFGYSTDELASQSFSLLYPSFVEYENIGRRGLELMRESGRYSDDRIMRRKNGELFWCHVAGRSLDKRDPFACAVWMMEDISAKRVVSADLTTREREIAHFLATGQTTKQIARHLGISPRTVEAHQARLGRKLGATSHSELISRLVGIR